VSVRRNQLMFDLNEMDAVAEVRPLTGEEYEKKALIATDLERTALLEEISWRKKSKALWLREGTRIPSSFIA
jgi:hypothetical protein